MASSITATFRQTSVDGASSSVRGWWSGVGLSARF